MVKERQLTGRKESEIDEAKIPQAFDLRPVYAEFVLIANSQDLNAAKKWLREILPKQLKSLIQEQVFQPLSPEDTYNVSFDESGKIIVNDPDYPHEPDIVKRAYLGVEYAKAQTFYEEIFDRYFLEAQQTELLVKALGQDEIFSQALINNLSKQQEVSIHGEKKSGFVSNWYTLAMPSSQVHQGNKSYFNIYRVVSIFENDEWQYFIQTQGYYHSLSWNKQAKKLVNKDQLTQFNPGNEEEMMLHIGRLSEKWNDQDPSQLLVKLGIQAGDWLLPWRIWSAARRQRKQERDINQAVEAIVEVFELEMSQPDGNRWERLKIFFESIGNPLLWNKSVPKDEIVKQVKEVLLTSNNREKYLGSLVGSIPSILNRTGGFFICGSLSAGGITQQVAGANVNGFGGIANMGKDTCLTCPSCHQPSTSGTKCSVCGFGRGMDPHKYAHEVNSRKLPTGANKPPAQPSIDSKTSGSNNFFEWFGFGKNSITVSQALLAFGPKDSISLTKALAA